MIEEEIKVFRNQLEIASNLRKIPKDQVKLAEINKYVGYQSKHTKVTLRKTKGWLKKMAKEVKLLQPNLFILRYFVFDRETGSLSIYNKPKGNLRQKIDVTELQYVSS